MCDPLGEFVDTNTPSDPGITFETLDGKVISIPTIFLEDATKQEQEAQIIRNHQNKAIRQSVHDLLSIYQTMMQTIYLHGPFYLRKGQVVRSNATQIDEDVKADAINVIRSTLDRLHEITEDRTLWRTSQ